MTTPESFVSGPTQELIDLCHLVRQGATERLPELEAKGIARQQALSQAWEGFAQSLEAQSDEIVEASRDIIAAVETHFLAYSQALEKIRAFPSDRNPRLLEEAGQALAEASPGLAIAQSAWQARILTVGTTRFPAVNLFENLARRLMDGTLREEHWIAACQAQERIYAGVISEIDASPSASAPGIPERRSAAATVVEVLRRMAALSPSGPQADFGSALRFLTEALVHLEASVRTYNDQAFSRTPTSSARANQVIHAAQMLREGHLPQALLAKLSANLQDRVRRAQDQLEAADRSTAPSELVSDEAARMAQALEAMDEALETLKNASGASDRVERATKELEGAVERLEQSSRLVREHDEQHGLVLCPRCQAGNPTTARTCKACQGPLPRFAGSDIYGGWAASSFDMVESGGLSQARGTLVTKSMQALHDACRLFEKDALSPEEFHDHLRRIEEKVAKAQARLGRLVLPQIPETATKEERARAEAFLDFAGDVLGLLAQGSEECRVGLMRLDQYARERAQADMREGLRRFFDGCQKLMQIEQVAQAFVDALPPKTEPGGVPAGAEQPLQGDPDDQPRAPIIDSWSSSEDHGIA